MPLLFKLPLLLETEKEGLLDVDVEGDVLGKIVCFTEGVDDGYDEVGAFPHGDCVCEGRMESYWVERTAHLTTKAMHLAQMTADQTKTGSTMAGMTVRLIEMESNSAERTAHLTTKAMHLAQMTAAKKGRSTALKSVYGATQYLLFLSQMALVMACLKTLLVPVDFASWNLAKMTADQTKTGSTMAGMT
eukprot:scaffold30538_cov101-Skeletonema_marinoi.AAC.2